MSNNINYNTDVQLKNDNSLLRNAVGYIHIVLMVLASAAPMVVVAAYVPISIGFGAGFATPLAYGLTTLMLFVFSIGFVQMAKRIVATGAFYTFVTQGLGRPLGLSAGFASLFCYSLIETAILGGLGFFAGELFRNHFGIDMPWYVYSIIGLTIIYTVSYFKVTLTARILSIALVLEMLIILIVDIGILGHGGKEGILFSAFSLSELAAAPAIGIGFFLAFWSWIGFEGTAIYGEETVNAKDSVPRATYTAVVALGIFYTFSAFMGIVGYGRESMTVATQNTSGYYFDLAATYTAPFFRSAMDYFAVTGFFACAFAFHNNASRYLYSFGRDGILPKAIGKTHPKYRSPYVASTIQSTVAIIIVLSFAFAKADPMLGLGTWIAIIATLSILTVQFLVCLAVIGYFNKIGRKTSGDYFKTLVAPIIGAIAQLTVIILLINNLTFLAASESIVVKMIPVYVLAVYIIGIVYAYWLKNKATEKYELIGIIREDEATQSM